MNFESIINICLSRFAPHLSIVETAKVYRIMEEQHLKQLISTYKIDCVFDIGASTGQYAHMLRNQIGFTGHIVSFEPAPDEAEILRINANNDEKWHIFEQAVSSENGVVKLNLMSSPRFSSLSQPKHEETQLFTNLNKVVDQISVKSESLSSIYKTLKSEIDFDRPFLKMDTQGLDVAIVRSGSDVLHNFIGLQSELSVKKIYEDSVDFRDAIDFYEEQGFSLSSFVPNNSGHFPQMIETDCIMVRTDLIKTADKPL